MNKTPLAFFVGGAVTCAILLAVVTRDRWQGQPSAVETAATSGQSTEAAASATAKVKVATGQTSSEQSTATTAITSESGQQEATPPADEPAKEAEKVAAIEPKIEPAPEQKAESVSKTVEPAQPADAEPAKSMVKPTFDLITVAPDGLATISGRAEPGAKIAVMLDQKVLGNALTNETKTWHLAPEPFLPSGDHNLTATATLPDGMVMQFEQSVTVAIDDKGEKRPLIVLSEPSAPSRVLQKPEPEPQQPTEAAMAANAKEDQQPTVEAETVEKPTVEQEVAAADTASNEPATESGSTTTPIVKLDSEPAQKPVVETEPESKAEVQPTTENVATPEPDGKTDPKSVVETIANAETETTVEPEPKAEPEPITETVAKAETKTLVEAEQEADPEPVVKTTKAPLILDTVDYNDTGNIIFSGKSDPGGKVRIYVDGQYVGDALADASGSWVFKGNENISSGLHKLRIDQVQSNGTVVQRRELPFERADPIKVAELQSAQSATKEVEKSKPINPTETATISEPAEPEKAEPALPANGKVVIQPGNNLWNISRVIYGRGIEYTAIYEANKDQIRDPHRIYPGQIFTTPGTVPPEEIDPDRREPFSTEEKHTQ